MSRPNIHRLVALVVSFVAVTCMLLYLLAAETARGDVVGVVKSEERGAPLPGAEIALASTDSSRWRFETKADAQGRFVFARVPIGNYRIAAHSLAHKQAPQRITVLEGQTTTLALELSPVDPFLDLYVHQRVFTPSEEAEVRCRGFGAAGSLELELYRVDFATAVAARQRGLTKVLSPYGGSLESLDLRQVRELVPVAAEERKITTRDLEGIFNERLRLPQLAAGVYLVAVNIDELRCVELITITDLGIVVKRSPRQALIYAVDIESGQPRPEVEVSMTWGGKPSGRGVTDEQGLLELPLPQVRGSGRLDISARRGESFAFVDSYRWYSPDYDGWRVYTYTDRPAYRPGQTVYFKSIVRQLVGKEYRVPAGLAATVKVHDDKENLIYRGQLKTNEHGTLYDELELAENALPGLYSVAVSVGEETKYADFEVLEYRKPEYEVRLKTDQARYVRGDTVRATVQADYYYGSPVAGAEVRYEVTRSEYWFFPDQEALGVELYEPYGYGEEGEIVLTGQGRTNSAGELVIEVPTQVASDEQVERPVYDRRYSITAQVTDPSRRSVSGSCSVIVTQGEYYLAVRSNPSVLGPDDPTTIKITALDYEGNPVANAPGYAKLQRSEWSERTQELDQEASATWTTDAQGKAEVVFTPRRKARYCVLVIGEDSRGNKIRAEDWLWVTDGRYASFSYPYGELELKADKPVYEVGDVARIVINTEYAPATALVTVEGDDIYRKELVELGAKSTIIEVPVIEDYMPGCYVSVAFVRKKKFFSRHVELAISRRLKALQVSIEPDRDEYRPGQPAKYLIKTTDPDGQPVAAEISLAVTDEAVHAIAPDRAGDILKHFYARRYLEVRTDFSFAEIYLSGGDKAGRSIQTRKYFPDTAFWAPAVVTGRDGQASLEFDMPDSLTTWRATVRANTLGSSFGQSVEKVVCSKPFLVRLEAPRFFTQKDEVVLSNIVHNRTSQSLAVNAGLDAENLEISGKLVQSAQVGPGQVHRFEWPTSVPTAGEKKVRVWAEAGELSDAMELTIPVVPKGRRRVEVRVGAVTEEQIERLQIREDAIPNATSMQIRLTPSLASGMLGSLDYLAAYPYGCTEQTMSAFLPDVVIAQMLAKLGISVPRLERELPKMVQAGLLKLYDMQHDDGGWGWWRYDDTDPWMTAYVVFGLVQAERAGFTVNQSVLGSGTSALVRMAERDKISDENAFAAYVLSLKGHIDRATTLVDRLLPGRSGNREALLLDSWSQALVVLTLHELGRDREARSLLAGLRERAEAGEGIVHWEGSDKWSDIETTAMVLKAMCAITLRDQQLADVVRWLMLKRQGGHWHSTRDTAFVLYALADYLQITGELAADLAAVVELNDERLISQRFTADDVFKPELVIDVDPGLLTEAELALNLAASGTGRLYYTAELAQYVPAELETETLTGQGLTIRRSYQKLGARGASISGASTQPLAVRSGDVIEVSVKLTADREFEYLMVEDPLPAGCEVPGQGRIPPWEWHYWWADRVVRDELVAFAITRLPTGTKTLKYKLIAQIPGKYSAMPTQVYNMYDPRVRAAGTVASITIKP